MPLHLLSLVILLFLVLVFSINAEVETFSAKCHSADLIASTFWSVDSGVCDDADGCCGGGDFDDDDDNVINENNVHLKQSKWINNNNVNCIMKYLEK